MMERLRKTYFDMDQMAGWASKIIMELGSKNDKERRALDGLEPEFLSYIGLGRAAFSRPHVEDEKDIIVGPCRKRRALLELDPEPKRAALAEDHEDNGLESNL